MFDFQVDLLDFIDWSGVECLNQSSNHSLPNALKQVSYSLNVVVCLFTSLCLWLVLESAYVHIYRYLFAMTCLCINCYV